MTDDSEAPRRLPWWLTTLGPVGLGVLVGLGSAFMPWLAEDEPDLSTAERFWSPVTAGVIGAVIVQAWQWWTPRKDARRQDEAVLTLLRLTGLVVMATSLFVLLLDPGALLLLLVMPVLAGLVAPGIRRPSVTAENRRFGLYCACMLCLLLCTLAIMMALTPVS